MSCNFSAARRRRIECFVFLALQLFSLYVVGPVPEMEKDEDDGAVIKK